MARKKGPGLVFLVFMVLAIAACTVATLLWSSGK